MDNSIYTRNLRNRVLSASYRQWRDTPNSIYIERPNTFSYQASVFTSIQDITKGSTECCDISVDTSNYIAPTVPNAPTNLTGTIGNQTVEISFIQGSDGGSPIINYEFSTDGGDTFQEFSPNQTSSPIVLEELTNGTTYVIILRAVNAIGPSINSQSISLTPGTTPGQPTSVTGTSADQSVLISFTAPTSDGGRPITNYEYSIDGGSTFTGFSPADTTSPLTIGGLTNGTIYNIQIRAVNSIGSGASSSTITVTAGVGTINLLILGDSNRGSLVTTLNTAKTNLGYSETLNITTQLIQSSYAGDNLNDFDVVFLYTNGGLSFNSSLGTNLNTYASNGGNIVMASFCWGNVSIILNLNYDLYSTFPYVGPYSLTNTGTVSYPVTHPINDGISTSSGYPGSQNIPNVTLTTGSTTIGTYPSNGRLFLAVKESGSSRFVGINSYINSDTNLGKIMCRAVFWCAGII